MRVFNKVVSERYRIVSLFKSLLDVINKHLSAYLNPCYNYSIFHFQDYISCTKMSL